MPKKPHEIDVANPPRAGKSVKFMALHLARQLGKTERARLEELRRRGWELVRRG